MDYNGLYQGDLVYGLVAQARRYHNPTKLVDYEEIFFWVSKVDDVLSFDTCVYLEYPAGGEPGMIWRVANLFGIRSNYNREYIWLNGGNLRYTSFLRGGNQP